MFDLLAAIDTWRASHAMISCSVLGLACPKKEINSSLSPNSMSPTIMVALSKFSILLWQPFCSHIQERTDKPPVSCWQHSSV